MEELFGLSMNVIMAVLLAIFLGAMSVVAVFAGRNRIMVKLGLRNIPRRPGQTVLIVVGVMLSTLIISAAFGTGDTLSFSIRDEAVKSLGKIDEVIIPIRSGSGDTFGSTPYIPYERFQQLTLEVADIEIIDGMMPVIDEAVPTVNLRTSLSEGHMRVVGVDPALLEGFGAFTLTSGEEIRLEDLRDNEVYITDRGAEELDAVAGDELRVFLGSDPLTVKVKGVINRYGLAGFDPTVLISLERAQGMFDRAGQINLIAISNRGDELTGAELSREVTQELRVLFNDREVASHLKELLNQKEVLKALEEEEETLSGHSQEDVSTLRKELQGSELSDELISLLADQDIVVLVLDVLDQEELQEVEREATTLFLDLAEFRVLEFKRQVIGFADDAGSFVTTFFLVFSLFSITVGILLIFLIFVMLAAARRSEMGMARAIGAKRRHMVQMFVFEGTAYSLVSAAVGVLLGLAVSTLMVVIINRIFGGFGEGFRFTPHFEARTIIVSYCLGMGITFATVAVSAYQVSRLNIVSAIRGLPTPITVSTTGWRVILLAPWRALLMPFRLAWRSVLSLVTLHPLRALAYLLQAMWAVVFIPLAVIRSIPQVFVRFFMQGWLAFFLGLGLTFLGINVWERDSAFSAGVSLMIIGLGLMLRTGLKRSSLRADMRDRIAFTFMGVVMLVFWNVPVSWVKDIVGELEGDFDMMFVSGIFMVAAAVWTVMYNTDLLLRALTFATGRIGKLRPVLVTAVAYPLSAKFRTGLTLAMFALVIFTLMVMSILSETFATQFTDPETFTGGWHIEGEVNPTTPIEDIRRSIDEEPNLRTEDFEAIGGYTWLRVQVRPVEGENQRWGRLGVRAANDAFLEASDYKFKLIAEGYGTTPEEVWQAMRNDPSLAVVGGNLVHTLSGSHFGEERPDFMESVYYDEEKMSPADIEIREPRTGEIFGLTVVGVLDREHEAGWTMLTSKTALDNAIPFSIPITHYRFSTAEGVNTKQVAKSLESSFLEHGMETVVLEEELEKEASGGRAFFRLFIGFMALGLVVGIAALGVVSTRAVVERRQQIGVLRAIGYRRGMIQLSFLMESSFVSLLGIAIGATLGISLGYQAYTDIKEEEAIGSIRFVIPWMQVGIILGLTYLFSLLATFLPARQASRIYPAEALRYE